MSADYEKEQTLLEVKTDEMKAELETYNADGNRADEFIKLVKKHTEFGELTTEMLNGFVHKIIVHKAVKTEWERTQKVDIIFNFIGEFKLLQEEISAPTPEEIEAEEKWREQIQKRRESCRRSKEKKRAEYEKSKTA